MGEAEQALLNQHPWLVKSVALVERRQRKRCGIGLLGVQWRAYLQRQQQDSELPQLPINPDVGELGLAA